jgi:hypothetical protein
METNRRPVSKKNVEAFVPSPRFLSESPRKPTPAHISRPGQSLPPHNAFSPSPSIRQLHSPVPPPPANLFGGNPDAFNVDPGVPFLATAGPSDADNSDKGSITEFESPKRSVGGFVTGLKKALTIKGSRRRSSRYQQEEMYPPPMLIRDSGYATSDQLEPSLSNQQPPLTTLSPAPPPSSQDLPLGVASEPPFNYYPATNVHQNDASTAASLAPPSLDSMASAVTALVGYGPDYIKMDRPTPPQSDVSFNTYMARFQNFLHDLAALPWMASERVTVDYYPTANERPNKPLPHRPLIIWRSDEYNHADYHLDSDSIDSLTLKMTPHLRVRAPSHASRTDINLDSEFSDKTHSPFPYHPPQIAQTPDHRRVRSEGFEGEIKSPSPPQAFNSPLPQRRGEGSFSNPTLPNWGNAPDTLSLFPPNSSPTPNMMYPEESRPASQNDPNPLLQTPSARKYQGGPEELPSFPPSIGRMHGEDPRRSRTDANATFSTPTRHRPASVQRWESTPNPTSETYPFNRSPNLRSRQQFTSGSPSRRSHKSHTTSRRPRGESTEEWESFPQDRPGYVPFEFSENYYGTQYGVGIHGLLPPVVSDGASPAPSIKQPQPQYPKSTFVTPPSRASSS